MPLIRVYVATLLMGHATIEGSPCGTRMLSKLEHTSVMITTNLTFSEWASVFGD